MLEFICIYSNSYWIRLASYVFMGVCQLKNGVLLTYGFEICTQETKSLHCSIINSVDMTVVSLMNFYVLYISKNWKPFFLIMTWLGVIACTVFVAFAPESPKWLLIEGRTQEAMTELSKIAKFNGSDKEIKPIISVTMSDTLSSLSLGTKLSNKSARSVLSENSARTHQSNAEMTRF